MSECIYTCRIRRVKDVILRSLGKKGYGLGIETVVFELCICILGEILFRAMFCGLPGRSGAV